MMRRFIEVTLANREDYGTKILLDAEKIESFADRWIWTDNRSYIVQETKVEIAKKMGIVGKWKVVKEGSKEEA